MSLNDELNKIDRTKDNSINAKASINNILQQYTSIASSYNEIPSKITSAINSVKKIAIINLNKTIDSIKKSNGLYSIPLNLEFDPSMLIIKIEADPFNNKQRGYYDLSFFCAKKGVSYNFAPSYNAMGFTVEELNRKEISILGKSENSIQIIFLEAIAIS